MASEVRSYWQTRPAAWLTGAIACGAIAGLCFGHGSFWWILFAVCSCSCAIAVMHGIASIQRRLSYVVEATLSGDFSYKFPTSEVNGDQRAVNEMLNRIVEHLECLTKEVRENEIFLGRMIDLTDIGLVIADAKGDVRLHNDAALRLLERQALTNVCQIPEQAYADLDIKKGEVTVNERSFSLYTINDLSRRMQEVEVESWEKLTRVLTHEIMNSLTPIQSIAETMREKAPTPNAAEAFATISSSSRSLMQFVRNFREFNRLPEPQKRAIYLRPFLESCVRMSESCHDKMDITVSLTCFPTGLMVYTDEALLRQVLINILKNAIEANPSHISINADEKADESIEVRISNDGELIPDDTAGQIFTPFFTTRENGNGIGLSLSRRIITHLGGTLTFKTRPITVFSVRL